MLEYNESKQAALQISIDTLNRVSEVFRKNKKGGVIIPDDNIT